MNAKPGPVKTTTVLAKPKARSVPLRADMGPLTKWPFGVRRQSEAATAPSSARGVQERQTLPVPKRCRAPLATALQSGLPETARLTLSLAQRGDMLVKLFCLWVLTQTMFVAPCRAAMVRWVGGSGDWGDTRKWSGGATPGQNDDAVIDTSNGAITVTISSGTVQVNTLSCEETLLLKGGTILGGTVSTDSGGVLVVKSGTLDGVTVNGVLDVGSSYSQANLTVIDGLVLNGTALVGNSSNSQPGAISFAGNQVLGGNGTVVFGNASGYWANDLVLASGGTTLVIGSGITVRGQNGVIGNVGGHWAGGPANVSLVNQGTVSADVSGGTITVNAQPFSNQGLVMSPAGTLSLAGTVSGLGTFQSGEGVLALSGVLTNAGQTLTLNGSTNVLTLGGGTILGGAITTTNGASFIVQSGTLDGVTVNGVLDVGSSYSQANLTVIDGLVLNGTALVGNSSNSQPGAISFAGNQVLGGNGTVVFGNASGYWANDLVLASGGTTLVIGSGITVRGQNGVIGNVGGHWAGGPANVSLVNQGTVSADVSGGTITVNAQPFSNQGLVMSPAGTLSLAGTVSGLGTFQSGEGVLALSGVLTNAGQTLTLNGSTNVLTLGGGTILGGAITTTNGASFIVQSGTLDGVTVNGVLDVGSSYSQANLTVIDGLVLNGTALVGNSSNSRPGAISFAGNQVLGGNGTVVFGNASGYWANDLVLASGGTTLVIGSGITVRGQNGVIGNVGGHWAGGPANVSLVNQGTVLADVSGGTIAVAGSSFGNAGRVVESVSGAGITVTANTINTGLVEADHGAITFSGGFTQNAGTLSFGLSSPADFGQISLNGAASVGGTLAAQLDGGYLPNAGDSFTVLNYGNNTVAFTNLNLPAGAAWQTNLNQGVLTLVVEGILPGPVTISPTNQTVAAGSTVTFAASASGPGPFGYQWLQNGVALTGATNSSLVLSNVTSAASGAYTVQVSNANGAILSAAAGLSVLGPPAITAEPQSQTVVVGTTVTFLVTATGAPPLSYQWSFDGQALPGATNMNLTLTNVTRAQAGNYSVVVSNAVGSVTSAPLAALSIATGVPCPGTPSGMVAWWRGEENTSDYAGTNDAVFEGVAGYGPGEVGQAFLFDGSTSCLQVPDNPLWAFGTNDFTIELWANFLSVFASDIAGDGSTVFVGQDEGSGPKNKWFFGFGGGLLYFYIRGPALAPTALAQATFGPITNQWYHLALTMEKGVYHCYLNGAQVSAETNGVPVPTANAPLTIGQAQGFYMNGLLDEISLYNRALGASETPSHLPGGSAGKVRAGERAGNPLAGAGGRRRQSDDSDHRRSNGGHVDRRGD